MEPSQQARPTICHLLHGLRIGGAEVLAAGLARKLRESYRVVFGCLDEIGSLGEELRREGFRVELLGRRSGVDWRCALRLADYLQHERVQLVHAHQYTPFFYGLAARVIWRRPPIVFTEHGRHYPDYPRPKRRFVNRLLLERRDRVLGVGEAVRQALIRNEGFPAQRVRVIYNGVDCEAIADGAGDRATIRREWSVGADALVIVHVARLDYLKDHATAVRALEHVVQQRPDACLVLIGEGPLLASLQDLLRQRGLTAAVRFLGLRTDVARLWTAADICLLSSISEGIPLTLIEAMAAGLPVVATRVGGVAEVVEDGRTGLLAPAGDDALLARHLLRIGADPELGRDMGRQGRQRAERLFSERQMHERYHKLYAEVLRS
jgi:glycosyltransferase involved in cell wall biosynthesis